MVIGIGKKDILEKFGIQQIVDLPVGENLRASKPVRIITYHD